MALDVKDHAIQLLDLNELKSRHLITSFRWRENNYDIQLLTLDEWGPTVSNYWLKMKGKMWHPITGFGRKKTLTSNYMLQMKEKEYDIQLLALDDRRPWNPITGFRCRKMTYNTQLLALDERKIMISNY